MRTFIAICLPQETKTFLAQLQNKLKKYNSGTKWVQPQNIHLTLKFLGEINQDQLDKIIEILVEASKAHYCFKISLSGIGAFPKAASPRILWVGLGQGKTETKAIAETLEKLLVKIGIPAEEKEFSAHITIGRVKSVTNRTSLIKELEILNKDAGTNSNPTFTVDKITLFKSILSPTGPVYEILKELNLKTS